MSSTVPNHDTEIISIDEIMATAQNIDEVRQAVAVAIAKKLFDLVAITEDQMSLEMSLENFGLDSLVAIELKNWFARTLQTAVQTSEILDAPSIAALAGIVAQRAAKHSDEQPGKAQPNGLSQAHASDSVHEVATRLPAYVKLDSLPLNKLESTLELYKTSVRAFCSDVELQKLTNAISELLKADGLGQRLQKRLQDRVDDPEIDNWQLDLYNAHVYLKVREPVSPFQQFYGCHVDSDRQDSQAERAAVISLAAITFKDRLLAGKIQQDYMKEQPLCMDSMKYIFNAYREPRIGVDVVQSQLKGDHLIVLRDGQIFQVDLKAGNERVSYQGLRDAFQSILDASDMVSTEKIATLTADDRDRWAKIREAIKETSTGNRYLMDLIESAAFIICLDDVAPTSSTARANTFLLDNISNRWSDKSLQFVICRNGSSALLCEHSMVDGSTYRQLNEAIVDAIVAHSSEPLWTGAVDLRNPRPVVSKHVFDPIPDLGFHINRVQRKNNHIFAFPEHKHHLSTRFGSKLLRSKKCSPKSGYQLVIQLASLLYFGYQPPSWETISMRTFNKGRVEIMQVVSPAVAEFCAAANSPDVSISTRRQLFYEAARAHTKTATRVARGRGFAGHLYALQEVLREGEDMPALFTDPTYSRTQPGKIMTDCTESEDALQEGGFMMPDWEHVWVRCQVQEDGCRFFVKTPRGDTGIFVDALEAAAKTIEMLITTD